MFVKIIAASFRPAPFLAVFPKSFLALKWE
jgi:hypothetical protein